MVLLLNEPNAVWFSSIDKDSIPQFLLDTRKRMYRCALLFVDRFFKYGRTVTNCWVQTQTPPPIP